MSKKSGLETPHEIQIGERVKRFRDQINWPQPPFASELGISRDKLASIEYGRTPLKYAIGYRMCFIFDVNHRWLTSGEGEVKAATAALELPRPEDVRPRALWSEICKKGGRPKGRTPGKAGKAAKPGKTGLIPRFDPTAHVISFISDLFAKEKFRSPLDRQEFALEVTSFARQLALRLRREAARDRHIKVPARSGEVGAKGAGAVSRLKESVRQLGRELKKLQSTADKSGRLSRQAGGEAEVNRLRETIEKIGAQIQNVETGLKILHAPRPE